VSKQVSGRLQVLPSCMPCSPLRTQGVIPPGQALCSWHPSTVPTPPLHLPLVDISCGPELLQRVLRRAGGRAQNSQPSREAGWALRSNTRTWLSLALALVLTSLRRCRAFRLDTAEMQRRVHGR